MKALAAAPACLLEPTRAPSRCRTGPPAQICVQQDVSSRAVEFFEYAGGACTSNKIDQSRMANVALKADNFACLYPQAYAGALVTPINPRSGGCEWRRAL
jgi:hypothetical protein